jgi:hypothetical protein
LRARSQTRFLVLGHENVAKGNKCRILTGRCRFPMDQAQRQAILVLTSLVWTILSKLFYFTTIVAPLRALVESCPSCKLVLPQPSCRVALREYPPYSGQL